uniref:Uncharacterized protein n=1 Tax=Mantoniella tinhauana virus 1 TaxID=3111543 RepID=A0AB38ZM53_9VIRU
MGLVMAKDNNVTFIKKVSLEDYKFIYSNDLVPLFVDDHKELFESADKILIERY